MFFVAYTRDNIEDRAKRPITFSFNGGPGSSSVWLHLGVLSSRRVEMGDAGKLLPPPYRLVDNAYSLLDESDLVFIDLVGTGYSRPFTGEKAKRFHAFRKDIESVGDFIRLYATRYKRWLSPKFLIGESYGTTRGWPGRLLAGAARHVSQRRHARVAILDFTTARFDISNDLPHILFLPTYAATAWYHRRLGSELQADLHKTLDEVETFALGEYANALMQGAKLSADARSQLVQKLARYTGLSPDYIERTNLRIEIGRFVKELLRDQRRTVGRLDSRFTGVDRDSAGERVEFDPSMAAITGPYTAALNDYVRGELNFASDLPYEILSGKVNQQWSFDQFNQYVSVSETLRRAMTSNPALKVLVANGYYDLATPYFATEYTFNHLALDNELQRNITMRYYEAGHMMYVHAPSLAKMKEDLAGFVRSAISS